MGDRDGADADQGSIHRHRSLRQRRPNATRKTRPALVPGYAGLGQRGWDQTKSPVRGTGQALSKGTPKRWAQGRKPAGSIRRT